MSWQGGLRPSGFYAVYRGQAFRASTNEKGDGLILFWREGEGPTPEDSVDRNVAYADVESAYRLRTTCSYRGGGPFEVCLYPKDPSVFWLVYRGDDVTWVSEQPGMDADFSGSWGYRIPEAVGLIRLVEFADVEEHEKTVQLPRRRRKAAQSERTRG